ncbi:DUF3971 domain-containing protein [Halomonas sp. 18H]|nr:AsmA-like C-terminal region-containing protein [Halomonas sp. 18H]MCW4151615.1 DUF3971 domain-containing protein [Halomonas sp. 18H]
MLPSRLVLRWFLTLLALALTLLAVLLVVLRLLLGQLDRWSPALESQLGSRFSAEVSLGHTRGGVAGLDPWLSLEDLDFRSREGLGNVPLLEVDQAGLRLDTAASLREGMPVLEQSRLAGVTLHLYQNSDLGWQWPAPADVPPELAPGGSFDLSRLDFWVGVLLRQRAWADDLRVVLHGRQRQLVLEAPRLLVTGERGKTHLEGEVRLRDRPGTAFQTVMEVTWQGGESEAFDAALQADIELDSLIGVAEVLGIDDMLRLDDAAGNARLWGRWQDGRLADVRVDLTSPTLLLNRDTGLPPGAEPAGMSLQDVTLQGQWLRDSEGAGWQAWFATQASAVDEPPSSGPPLPRFWQARGEGQDWWMTSNHFDLGALSAWHDRFPLPESLTRSVEALAPSGHVEGLAFGHRDGQWRARASASEVAVSPWQDAPGGGPLDLWLEADGSTGRVRFADTGDARLMLPGIFASPMQLDSARGEVVWSFAGPRHSVSGRNLEAVWNGARFEGGFGLAMDEQQQGGFGLQLAFEDVDALDRPLTDWLPMPLLRNELDAELADWLAGGVAGRVPQGALSLHVPFDGQSKDAPDAPGEDAPPLHLELTVEQGRVPFDPAWPALDNIAGQLRLEGESLSAEIEQAESLGVVTRDARLTLGPERVLDLHSPLKSSATAMTRYLAAMPVDGMAAMADWQGDGDMTGTLDIRLPMANPKDMSVAFEGQAALARLTHTPTDLTFESLEGPLAWQQQGDTGHLTGELNGRLLGGPFKAVIDTAEQGLGLSGRVTADALLALGAPAEANSLLHGETAWQGQLRLDGAVPRFSLNSNLTGLGIDLPAPLGKAAAGARPLELDMQLGEPLSLRGRVGSDVGLRWQGGETARGQAWIGQNAPSAWPSAPGWSVRAYLPRFSPALWAEALAPLAAGDAGPAAGGAPSVSRLGVATDCLRVEQRCLGSLRLDARPDGRGWGVDLDGSLLAGRLTYHPARQRPLAIALERLRLDEVVPDNQAAATTSQGSGKLFQEIDVPAAPAPMLDGVGQWPAGELKVASLAWQSRTFGPFNAHWRASPDQLTLDPVELTLGDIEARGNMTWEASGSDASLTRSRLSLAGGDVGSALAALGQPVAVTSTETRVQSQLAWPGAPWQFALQRSRGSLSVELREGVFANLESPSAKVVGLLNVDNLLRRLRLDFSDVTGSGTAFDSVSGDATLYGGVLETRGPVSIDGAATSFTLDGNVDLMRRELDLGLGVTVPVSNNLPLAAVVAGAPIVGGALFVADKLFGDAIDRVTQIHYRVRGPWTSPRLSLESTE